MDRKLDVRKIYESVKEKITFKPEAALVLGSGLGNFAEKVEIAEILDYKDIPGFPVSTVPGHNRNTECIYPRSGTAGCDRISSGPRSRPSV